MSPRAHLGLRLGSVIVLVLLAAAPRSRSERRDRGVPRVASATHLAVTTAARRGDPPGPRPARLRGDEPIAEAGDGPLEASLEALTVY